MPDEEKEPQYRPEDLRTVYQQLCSSIQTIDDFRSKLLGFLPLVSGAGIFLLLNEVIVDPQKAKNAVPYLLPIGAFGFVITLGLFFYELHGIKKCDHLINVGKLLEQLMNINGRFTERPNDVAGFINEPFTARIIYSAVLA